MIVENLYQIFSVKKWAIQDNETVEDDGIIDIFLILMRLW